ncbi:hypothetical protein OC845_001514 [Tilletia horrida]|nr:hypothetical protein OC845_001514 [Tilletia horrida]
MPSSSDVSQLVEMGIERNLAEAALAKYGRAADAAEAILEGRFEMPAGNKSDANSNADSMDEDGSSFADAFDADDDEDDFGDEDDGADAWSVGSLHAEPQDVDAYKNIVLSKDRKEVIIEIEQTPRHFEIDGTQVEEVTQSEWMKGCPEGNEQSLLFQVFQQWTEPVPCPSCSLKHGRDDSAALLAFWPSIQEFVDHARAVVQRTCQRCSTGICLACGESVSNGQTGSDDANSTRPKHKKSSETAQAGIDPRQDPLFHCAELQSLLVGVGLGHIQRLHLDERNSGLSQAVCTALDDGQTKRKRKSPPSGDDLDFDYDDFSDSVSKRAKSKNTTGTGYAGSSADAQAWSAAAAGKQQENDQALSEALALVRNFLPSLRREPNPTASDFDPHSTTLAHLRRRFLPIASKLLQSDSFMDMSERRVLYDELLQWLQEMSHSGVLAPLVAHPIMLSRSIEYKILPNGTRERRVTFEGSAGPRELLQSIIRQCETILESMKRQERLIAAKLEKDGAQQTKTIEPTKGMTDKEKKRAEEKKAREQEEQEETQRLLSFCQAIIGTTKKIDTLLRKTKGDEMVDKLLGLIAPSSEKALEAAISTADAKEEEGTEEETKKAYEAWAKTQTYADADFSMASMTTTKDPEIEEKGPALKTSTSQSDRASSSSGWRHAFGREIIDMADNSKRTMAIAKELASLQGSLPALWHGSIFLRVDESRIDVLKACVVGPEGSPYESGLFFFDIFLPRSYNSEPPKVQIMTTNGGLHRFNPNLYANGKVCLSLLGTWSGPGWVKGRSTLLQVLLSIQSLILGEEEPMVNEPGWTGRRGSESSLAYTKNLRRMTVATAMIKNLKEPPYPWREVIEGHFRAKAKHIIKLVDKWLSEDDGNVLRGDGAWFMNQGFAPQQSSTTAEKQSQSTPGAEFKENVETLKNLIAGLQTSS